MHHSMDADDTCYALDIIDDYISNFVQDTWMRDDFSRLLDDEEPPDGVADEIHHQDNREDQERTLKLIDHKTSQNKKRWKNFTTNKKKNSPLINPKACMYPLVLSGANLLN